MDGTLGLLGGHGKDSASAVSKVDASSEASSYPEESEIELRLGLSLGGAARSGRIATKPSGRILTAQDFPSFLSGASSSSFCSVSGTKRAADSVSREGGPATGVSQVVGWPPIKPCRINSLLNLAKTPTTEDGKSIGEPDKFKEASKKVNDGSNTRNSNPNQRRNIGFVKVNMDGLPIGRKVDLNAHSCYETMAQALEDMFFRSATIGTIGQCGSKLLNGSSEYVLTYEDKEGDWMLVGDVPWEMFVRTVKRLRIMKTSEANGLAPRSRGSNDRRNKPIYLHHLSVLS